MYTSSASSQLCLIPVLGERLSLDITVGLAKAPSSEETCTGLEGTEMQEPVCLDPRLKLSEGGSGKVISGLGWEQPLDR